MIRRESFVVRRKRSSGHISLIDILRNNLFEYIIVFFLIDNAAFCTGTAAEVVPIARLATGEGEEPFEVVFEHGQKLPGGPITDALLTLLRQVMVGDKSSKATEGWLRDPFASPEEFCKA